MRKRETKALMDVALGHRPAQLLVENCRLVNVYSGEILDGQTVATWGERIASVGSSRPQTSGATRVIDGKGLFLMPGFIDVHAHLDMFQHPLTLAEAALPTGTTAAYTESHETVGALGALGLDLLLDLAGRLPFHLFVGLPPAAPQYPEWEGDPILSLPQVRRYLRHKRVLGLSEVIPWVRILAQEDFLLDELSAAGRLGKRIEGHTAGASGARLQALAGAGLTSCHESITAQEVIDRLRLGLYTMMRHGSIRADMEELAKAFRDHPDLDTSRVMLTPDTVFPSDLIAHGYMDNLIAVSVEAGIPPMKAIQMSTINPATYMRMESHLGGVAPGRYADMVLAPDLRRPRPEMVICRGEVVATHGKLLKPFGLSLDAWTRAPWREGRWPKEMPGMEDLRAPASVADGSVTLPTIHLGHKVLTQRREVTLPVRDGAICLDPDQDVVKVAMVNRSGDGFVKAFVSGIKAPFGGLASTMAHDHHHLMVLGSRDEDMLLAVERLKEIGGGMAIVDRGRLEAELPCPIGGVQPSAPLTEVASQMNGMADWLKSRGCPLESPLFTIVFMSFASLPALRMTPSGILDVKMGRIIYP
ncbi:MAG: adenine deaminase C-terminal domain-containing protein [Dehalococcoidia bacterium]|nr:adenine deaminase C-terminal domain-containing protein [Dehalococcoidia bacterium]